MLPNYVQQVALNWTLLSFRKEAKIFRCLYCYGNLLAIEKVIAGKRVEAVCLEVSLDKADKEVIKYLEGFDMSNEQFVGLLQELR